jgi:hypothetical protein
MKKDPCKAGKCISYPICLNKRKIDDCIIFTNYITKYIRTYIQDKQDSIQIKLTPEQLKLLWDHVEKIFPNMEFITYTLRDAYKTDNTYLDLYHWSISGETMKAIIKRMNFNE